MNNERRKLIRKALEMIGEARDLLDQACSEEQEYYDAMPDSIRDGEKGQRAESVADDIASVVNTLDDIDLEDALS